MIGRRGSLTWFASWCVGTYVASSITLYVQRAVSGPDWLFYPIAVGIALVLIFGSYIATLTIIDYIGRPDTREVAPDVQAWKLATGTGVVSTWISFLGVFGFLFLLKWINFIGMFGFCFLLAVPFALVAAVLQ